MHFIIFLILLFSPFTEALVAKEANKFDDSRKKESVQIDEISQKIAKFYEIPPDAEIRDITEDVLNSPLVKETQKQSIRKFQRRIIVFTYPSDGLKIKGLISFVPEPQNYPTLVFLRGGCKTFGIANPGGELISPEQYTVIATMYRDGVSEGVDEYGGDDVNDVKNLINFIPELEKEIGIDFQNQKMFLLGSSRGAMQMFLALARFPELQDRFSKIVSLTGLLDMHQFIAFRPDIEEMFSNEYGFVKGGNNEEWINKRDPLSTVDFIRPDLPILILQGTDDNRISLQEGYNMVGRLQSAGKNVTYKEIPGGNHGLTNIKDRVRLILDWLEE